MKYIKQKTVRTRFILSYMFIILICILFLCIQFLYSKSALQKQIEITSSTELTNFSKNSDNNFNTLGRYSDMLGTYLSQELMNYSNPKLDKDSDASISISNFISSQVLSLPYIEDILLYDSNTQTVLTSTGCYDPNTIFYSFFYCNNADYDTWFKQFTAPLNTTYNTISFSNAMSSMYSSHSVITVSRTCIIKKMNYNVIYLVNANAFFENIQNPDDIFIISGENIVFGLSDKYRDILTDVLKKQSLSESTPSIPIKYDKNNYVISTQKAKNYLGTYVQVLPAHQYSTYIKSTYKYFAVFFISFILIGLILAYWLTCINYKPLLSVVKNLPNNISHSDANEFENITLYLNNIKSESSQSKQKIDKYISKLTSLGVEQLLSGTFPENVSRKTLIEKYNILFPFHYFYPVIFHIEKSTEWNYSEIKYLIKNVLDDLFNIDFKYYSFDTDNSINLIINSKIKCDDKISKNTNSIKQLFKNEFNVEVNAFWGNICNSFSSLSISYSQCLSMVNKTEAAYNIVFLYNSIKSDILFLNTLELIDLIVFYIKSGNDNFAINAFNLTLSVSMIYGLEYNRGICLLYHIASLLPINNNITPKILLDYIGTMPQLKDAIEYFKEFITKLTITNSNTAFSSKDTMPYEVCKYIEENVADTSLSVSDIAQHFNKSIPYISKLFKDKFEINLSEYIQVYRINLALYMTRNTSLLIKDIAVQFGFSNDTTFIRTFKKFVGISPSEYKQSVHNKKDEDSDTKKTHPNAL